ncbi:AAA family ATPase [Anoxybacillus rupiensis]|uniref:AAA family ATPase n=1 Tax=Anoxybacteroides rupiense TaxID=311460 RepID=A0ABD5IXN2_9BACL|nr:AAA family ATPase [Anoxybacillus rupiensis]
MRMVFYSNSHNVGKRTISQAFALRLAKEGKRVLYVETDYKRPSFAISTGLSHEQKNILRLIEKKKDYDVMDFIANKNDVLMLNNISKTIAEKIQQYPDTFYFLAFPADFHYMQMPEIEQKQEFVQVFLQSLKHTEFDHIIFSVANELSYMLSYPVILEADMLFIVIGNSPIDAIQVKHELDWMKQTNLALPKTHTIVNFVNSNSSLHELENILEQKVALIIPYDNERKEYEWSLKIGSPSVDAAVETLLQKIGVEISIKHEKRSIFARFTS